jgi:hypothetical protein
MEMHIDITIDISKLEECKETIKNILDTVSSFSLIDLPMELCMAYWALSNAIKWLEVLNGDTNIDDLYKVPKPDVCNLREGHRRETLRSLRGQTPDEEAYILSKRKK